MIGTRVIESPFLTGHKNAIKKDGKLIVSPAMMSLMRNANAREMEELLRSIKVIDFDPKEKSSEWWLDTFQIIAAQSGLSAEVEPAGVRISPVGDWYNGWNPESDNDD